MRNGDWQMSFYLTHSVNTLINIRNFVYVNKEYASISRQSFKILNYLTNL